MTWAPAAHKRFYDASELRQAGLTYYRVRKLIEQGTLVKHGNKVYENTGFQGNETDFSIVSSFVPKGVFCMMSAARFYGLTTYLPDSVDIAIERSMKISTYPEWPAINVWYFSEERFTAGVTTASDEAGSFQIYDMEKTVVDILHYRNKVGIEETKDVLKNYLFRNDRNLTKLHRYADQLGCGKILSTYLEVLL